LSCIFGVQESKRILTTSQPVKSWSSSVPPPQNTSWPLPSESLSTGGSVLTA